MENKPGKNLKIYDHMQNWEDGLQNLDHDQIKAALEFGIDANKYVHGFHPLEVVLTHANRLKDKITERALELQEKQGGYEVKVGPDGEISDNLNPNVEFNKHVIGIIDLLLEHGMSLTSPMPGRSGSPAMTYFLGAANETISTKIMVEGIKQSVEEGKPFKFDLQEAIQKSVPPEDANVELFVRAKEGCIRHLNFLQDTHASVRMALVNGEYDFVRKHGEDLQFWLEDFPMPDTETIDSAFPIDEAKLAKQKFKRVSSHITANGQSVLSEAEEKKIYASARVQNQASHDFRKETAKDEDIDDYIKVLEKEDPADILRELDDYVGLDEFKKSLKRLYVRVIGDKRREALGLPVDTQNYHTAFLGNPGTGKTTCARFKARFMHALDLCGPNYAELTRDDIVGKFIGHTENQLKAILAKSDIAFIDEAYALVDGSNDGKDFGKKAVDTLVGKLGSKDDDFTLFVAGYTEPMKQFIASNKGLKRRIKVFEDMYDFTTDELGKILDINLKNQNLSIDADAKKFLLEAIAKERDSDPDNFGNAGIVVDLVQSLPNYVDERLAREAEEGLDTLDLESLTKRFESFSAKDLCGITLEDVKGALFARTMTEQTKKNELSADNDDDTWQPKIGFHAGLGASAMIAPSTADRNRAMRAKAAKL